MKKIISFILFVNLLVVVDAQDLSQYRKKEVLVFEEARQSFSNQHYENALSLLDKLLLKNPDFIEAYLLKSDIYSELGDKESEIRSLQLMLKCDSLSYPRVYFNLGKSYFEIGQYENSRRSLLRFIEIAGNKQSLINKARLIIENCEYALQLVKDKVDFSPVKLDSAINSIYDEYWPSLSLDGNTMVFTRLVPFLDTIAGRKFMQEDFYIANKGSIGWGTAKPIDELNTVQNEGAQSLSPDAKILFFTACSRNDTWGGCDLYYSIKRESGWSVPQNAGQPVNSSAWESQPSISSNNKYLYFVSNRKGGKGGMDIWRCEILNLKNNQIEWGKLENLGDSVNTKGNEMSPFIHPDNQTLYFSSNYWKGMGGTDIFFSKFENTNWSSPENLGYPINTYHDEQGMVVDASGNIAYYASNRDETGMDIYQFRIPEKAKPREVTYVAGKIFDKNTLEFLLANVEIVDLSDADNSIHVISDEDGSFFVSLVSGTNYLFNVKKDGYLFYSESFELGKPNYVFKPYNIEVPLVRIELGAKAILRNIFFETNSFKLLDKSKAELKNLIAFLVSNPTVKIEIGGHTDNIGSADYNLNLSMQRAKSVFQYLLENGIKAEQLEYKGYGFTMPLNKNENEGQRSVNRRTEFKIISK